MTKRTLKKITIDTEVLPPPVPASRHIEMMGRQATASPVKVRSDRDFFNRVFAIASLVLVCIVWSIGCVCLGLIIGQGS